MLGWLIIVGWVIWDAISKTSAYMNWIFLKINTIKAQNSHPALCRVAVPTPHTIHTIPVIPTISAI
jgi:hypothetical protein